MGAEGDVIAPTHQELIEQAAWQRLRAALFRHDLEHSPSSWLEGRRAHREWSATFLVDEPVPTEVGP